MLVGHGHGTIETRKGCKLGICNKFSADIQEFNRYIAIYRLTSKVININMSMHIKQRIFSSS